MRGKRDEVDFLGAHIQGAMYVGRVEEASQLAVEWQARMEQASRGARTGEPLMNVAINEALVGLGDAARARMESLRDRDLLTHETLDEQLTVAAVLQDAPLAKASLAGALEDMRKDTEVPAELAQREKALRAINALAEGKPAEALAFVEPLVFDSLHRQDVTLWSIAHMRLEHWAEAAKGFAWLEEAESVNSFNASPALALANLARAQAHLGKTSEARKTYERLFKVWKDADANLPLLVQAKAEYAKLSAS
jgi:tetratricopeptide (TPR) repeat protein